MAEPQFVDTSFGLGGLNDSDPMNAVIRMVIPMRREFGRALDVTHFLHDFAYAQSVLDQAKQSVNPRLSQHAAYLESKMFGPRNSTLPAPTPAAPAPAAPVVPSSPTSAQSELEAKRAALASHYVNRLR
jgi:hypothetical protein